MKKVLVLLGSVFMAGCFICHKTEPKPQEEVPAESEIVVQQAPAPQEIIVTRYTISEAANFQFNSKEPRADEAKIEEIIKDIQNYPNTILYVEGHTDNIGTEEYNKDLSLQRANAIAKKLIEKGCSASQINVYGAGSSMPIASNDTEEGRARNRRVDVALIRDNIK